MADAEAFLRLDRLGKVFRFTKTAMLWGAIGSSLGIIVAFVVLEDPDASKALGTAGFLLLGAVGGLTRRSKRRTKDRFACLEDAQRAFLRELVGKAEYGRMKRECLERYPE